MPQLDGSTRSVALSGGYALRTPGLRGTATIAVPRTAAERSISRVPADGTDALDAALDAANITEVRQVDIHLQPTPPADTARALRAPSGEVALELEVPDLGPDVGQIVLACDESGVLTWHLPIDDHLGVQTPATRGSGGTKRFRIRATQPKPPAAGAAAGRSLLGTIGKKLLKVLIYPVTDPIVGPIGEFFAERWEMKRRPYGLRSFTPENRRTQLAGDLATADWDRLAASRALLFVHGTFSTSHGAFDGLPDDAFAALYAKYGGRVFAFDHFTLSHSPRHNVEWMLANMPAGRALDVDIVCHSRGGLVARTLAERPSVFGLDTSRVAVRRIVFAGVPNRGTLLAQPDHMMAMIDRLTSVLNLIPAGPVAETLEALVTAVKVIGHGALKGLEGLASMNPEGAFLKDLNRGAPAGAGYRAVAADFEPVDGGLAALIAGTVADAALDRIFQDAANDLVVPQAGVFEENGSGAFPIPESHVLRVPADAGVIHTTLFRHPPVARTIVEWLD